MRSRIALLGALCACVVFVAGAAATGGGGSGSISLTATGTAYTQDFNTLATTGTANALAVNGWFLDEQGTSLRADGNYAASSGTDNAGDVYSFGASANAERAFGTLLSGTLTPTIGAQFTNNTGDTIGQLAVAYTGEQWRLGASGRGADRLDFQISTDATSLTTGTWTDVNALDFSSPVTVGTVGALDGNASANRTAISANAVVSVAPGATFWIRWTDFNVANADDGLAVDDFSLTPSAQDTAPSVQSTLPANGAADVAVDSNVSVTFSEPVNVTGSWFTINCGTSGSHTAVVSGGPTTFSLNPDTNYAASETCTVTVVAANVTDQDTNDPPDAMAADYVFSFSTPAPAPGHDDVVVSEVYGGGGNAGASYKNDFIELYNRTAASISLNGWSVQYAAASPGTSWQVTSLSGSIAPGGYYLVQEAQGAGGDIALPSPDASGAIAMAAGAGKVALVSSTTALSGACPTGASIIDLVGYGSTANCFEGSGPAPTLSNTTSAQRKSGGAQDTDDNAADFTAGVPAPRGTTDAAPTVTSTSPANGASNVGLSANIVITFSEPVGVTPSWFTIECATSGSHAATSSSNSGSPGSYRYTLDPSADFAAGEQCTVTVTGSQVSDLDGFDPPDTMTADVVFSFTTTVPDLCGDPATKIHDVQGNGSTSPLAGSAVSVEGIVVGDYQQAGGFGGVYVQEEDADADADPATSEGIFVFSTLSDVAVGDKVRVHGTVAEFATGTSSLTELNNVTAVSTCSTGNALPAATNVTLPVPSMSDFERYEGMLVHFSQTLTATETFTLARFGEVSLAADGRLYTPTAVTTPGAAAAAQENLNRRRSFVLDDGDNRQNIDPTIYPTGGLSASNTLRSGYTTSDLTGVFDERFSTYRLQPVGPVPFTAANPRTPAPDAVGGNLRVASFNVLNFFNGNGTHQEGAAGGYPTSRGANSEFEFQRQLAKEVSALTTMNADVVGLMELENDAPPNSAIEDLVNGLNAATAPGTYAFINTGIVGTDEIRVGLLYKPARVTPVGAYRILDSSVDPRFIDTKNRPVLAQTFQLNSNGQKLTVVVNHLKSKGSDCNDVGDPDMNDGQGNCNLTRKHAVEAEIDWLATDPTASGSPDYLIIGDMNAYTFEDPITTWVNAGYHNLVRDFHGLGAYSYVFDGESGYLDQAIASPSLAAKATGATDWHINADEPIALDYNVEFKSANQVNTFYDPGPYRASDHDPVVIGLNLNGAPSVDAGGPYTVAEGGNVTVSATGNDPDGDTLSYAWDLDDNGSFETAGQSVTFDASSIDGPATRTIHVQATDPGQSSATASATVTIENADPSATFNAPATAFAGFPFTISLTSPSDPAPADTFTYKFDCGTGYGPFGAASSASCTSTSTGPLTVHGTIKDDDGGATEYTATVTVVVTYDSLCDLTRAYVTKKKVEDQLCHELDEAAKAEARGDLKKKQEHLDHYVKQVRKESGKSLTAEQAETLIALAGQL